MEQTDSDKCHTHIVAVTGLDYIIVTDRTTGFSYILHTALMRALNIIAKGEECIRSQTDTSHGIQPCHGAPHG